MNDLDNVAHRIERTEPMVGGKVSSQAIASLSKVFQTSSLRPIGHKIKEEATFYLFENELKERFVKTKSEELINFWVLWEEDF